VIHKRRIRDTPVLRIIVTGFRIGEQPGTGVFSVGGAARFDAGARRGFLELRMRKTVTGKDRRCHRRLCGEVVAGMFGEWV
jgi:hypothetical protein